jgi:hypothetical protein
MPCTVTNKDELFLKKNSYKRFILIKNAAGLNEALLTIGRHLLMHYLKTK